MWCFECNKAFMVFRLPWGASPSYPQRQPENAKRCYTALNRAQVG
ncbi:hypothetical protein [Kingella sp. (in: b-proteobacteria)]|nr:hypothetical protein [Kingella sp. (in: b-proteobacteria)]MDO4658641.1 hypothetical protein [Kingella sp. (in: b-proteobacteria)]